MTLTLWALLAVIAWTALVLPLAVGCGRAFAAGGELVESAPPETAG